MTENTRKYFDLHTQGIGYLNRARQVPVNEGSPFMAVGLSALHGSSENVQYTRFDCRVSGSQAEKLILEHQTAINDRDPKVLIGFIISDAFLDEYTPPDGVDLTDEQQSWLEKKVTALVPKHEANDGISTKLLLLFSKALGKIVKRPCLKARLLRIKFIKIDGETVYKESRLQNDPAVDQQHAA